MDALQQGLLALVRSGLTGETLALPEGFELKAVGPELVRHQVAAAGYVGAVNCGVPQTDPAMGRLFQIYCRSLRHSEQQQKLIEETCAAFDAAGVDYMPLKGCNLKGLYPSPELRTMGDADILIRVEQYDRIRPLLPELGFSEVTESDHELIWQQSGLLLELHKRLIPSYNKDYHRYFGDGWRLATEQRGTRWAMKREDEFIYLFTHFAKHYRDGGIGLRHLADLWVFRQACPKLDTTYICRELKKLRLLTFYENVTKTVAAWFETGDWDQATQMIIGRVCGSGAYGTKADHNLSAVARDAGGGKTIAQARVARARNMIFQPRAEMQKKYPILGKLPVLLPVFWVVRIFDVLLLRRGRLKKATREFRAANTKAVSQYQQELDLVGLKFDFEE
ncbi:MAG: nucleotidyltransferase family protein [Oscillospiraceae bacterium]|nr:nucleotidyltransferase family protein [Oscillospiraceae bacterium]